VVGVVSKPPAALGRTEKRTPSQVHAYHKKKLPGVKLWTPADPGEEGFLRELAALRPDLCVAASYDARLPDSLLAIPTHGAVLIHPSLLPRWRGAAALQRALYSGDSEVGVSVLFATPGAEADAGPVLCQSRRPLEGHEQFLKLVSELMATGAEGLVAALPALWAGAAQATAQDEGLATQAPKFAIEDAEINFRTMNARAIHNSVRAFSGSFGTYTGLSVCIKGSKVVRRTNILTTVLLRAEPDAENIPNNRFGLGTLKFQIIKNPVSTTNRKRKILIMTCGDGSVIGITYVHPDKAKQMNVDEWLGTMRKNRAIYWTPPRPPVTAADIAGWVADMQ
jgi:methionyl-tRNA formyltransferase